MKGCSYGLYALEVTGIAGSESGRKIEGSNDPAGFLEALSVGVGGKSDTGHTHAHSAVTGQTADDHHNQQHALGGADHTGDIGDLDGYTQSQVNALVDATMKAPEAFA